VRSVGTSRQAPRSTGTKRFLVLSIARGATTRPANSRVENVGRITRHVVTMASALGVARRTPIVVAGTDTNPTSDRRFKVKPAQPIPPMEVIRAVVMGMALRKE
jgi:hypothetical protein